jgi:glycosyltransferase involved in cell wall biosynthesis
MRIGMMSSDWGDFQESSPGGCTNIRMFVPTIAMVKRGMEVVIGEYGWRDEEGFVVVPTIARAYAGHRGPILNPKEYVGDLDVVIFKLWMWHEHEEYITRAKAMGQTVIADIDDWFDGLPTTNIAFETTHPKADPIWNRNHMIASYRHMSGLITSTKFLHDYYKNSNQNVIQIDNSLEPSDFIRRADVARGKPVIGWAGMMLWRKHDIQQLQGWLGDFLEKHDLLFYQAGVSHDNPKEFAEVAKINPDRFYGVSGCSTKNYGNILLPIDIGIVPLEKVSFNEAKSGLKGMEYSFTGVPFVATDTEEYKRLVADGAGNTARKTRDWIRNLERLLDPEQRKIDADRGYQTVMGKYNINIVVNKWIDTIEYIRSTNPKAR